MQFNDNHDRAQAILKSFEPLINHDLPNMIVALKGLLQMLHAECGEQMSDAGNDYLCRLMHVAGRLQVAVSLMRAINKVAAKDALPEPVCVGDILREAAAAAKPALTGKQLHFHSVLRCGSVTAPQQLLLQALTELVALLGRSTEGDEIHFYFTSRRLGDDIELTLSNCAVQTENLSTGSEVLQEYPASPNVERFSFEFREFPSDKPETRLRLVLVEELVATWNGTMRADRIKDQGYLFTLLIPQKATAGRA